MASNVRPLCALHTANRCMALKMMVRSLWYGKALTSSGCLERFESARNIMTPVLAPADGATAATAASPPPPALAG